MQRNSSTAEELESTAEELAQQAELLINAIAFFKIAAEGGKAIRPLLASNIENR